MKTYAERLEEYNKSTDNSTSTTGNINIFPENVTTTRSVLKDYLNTPAHYDNTNGSLYKIANERGWNAYQFDAIKRIDRVNKKGQFKEDIEKTIEVLKLMLNNL
jgi:hypothetical protein